MFKRSLKPPFISRLCLAWEGAAHLGAGFAGAASELLARGHSLAPGPAQQQLSNQTGQLNPPSCAFTTPINKNLPRTSPLGGLKSWQAVKDSSQLDLNIELTLFSMKKKQKS